MKASDHAKVWTRGAFSGSFCKHFLFDNLDMMLQQRCQGVRIDSVTFSQEKVTWLTREK